MAIAWGKKLLFESSSLLLAILLSCVWLVGCDCGSNSTQDAGVDALDDAGADASADDSQDAGDGSLADTGDPATDVGADAADGAGIDADADTDPDSNADADAGPDAGDNCETLICEPAGERCGILTNACGESRDCGLCGGCKSICVDTYCQPAVIHETRACSDGDVYWFDSCDGRQDIDQLCPDHLCSRGICRSRGPLDGTFMIANEVPAVADFLDEIATLGMNTVVVQATATKGPCICSPTTSYQYFLGFPDKLIEVLEAAQPRGINVYVGLILTGYLFCSDTGCPDFYQGQNAANTLQALPPFVSDLYSRSQGLPAFAGWYIPDEPQFYWGSNLQSYIDYYAPMVQIIRDHSSATLPILIAPGFAGSGSYSLQQVLDIAQDFFAQTQVDVLVMQDGVGSDGINLDWRPGDPTLGDFYSGLSDRIGAEHLWSDNEVFNCCVAVPSAAAQGPGSYRAASITRIDEQLQMTPVDKVAKRVVWLQQHHMGVADPNHQIEACRLQSAYRAKYGLGGQTITPASYTWSATLPPAPLYPDSGNLEMFDSQTGDPKNYLDSRWTGFDGSETPHYAEIVITLDVSQDVRVDWVALHLLHDESAGILLPTDLDLYCSLDGTSWQPSIRQTLDSYGLSPGVAQGDKSEYVFGNQAPLGWSCRYVKARLTNWWWTFVSEIEIVQEDQTCGIGN